MKRIRLRILSLILALLLLGSFCRPPCSLGAEGLNSGDCGEDGEHLCWSFCEESGLLTLSGSGAMRDFAAQAAPWAAFAGDIRGLLLPEGLTKIGSYAFSGCCGICELTLPASLTVLGRGAFADCSRLAQITLPAGLEEVRQEAFRGCGALEELDLPSTVTKIDSGALACCEGLQRVVIRNPGAVLESPFGTELYAPPPERLRVCGYLFSTAHAASVEAGQRFSSLGPCAVSAVAKGSCGSDLFWELDLRQGSLCLRGFGQMEDYRFHNPPWQTGKPWIQTVKFEGGITEIGARAFADCDMLRALSLPEGLKRIGPEAFTACSSLQMLELPPILEIIDSNAFGGCVQLQSVTLPDSLKQIREMAFSGCCALTEAALPEGLQTVGANAFMGCNALRTAVIPAGVRRVQDYAFAGCLSLNSVTLRDGVEEIGACAFSDCPALEQLKLSAQLKTVGTGAFSDCTHLQALSLPRTLREIGPCAFQGCAALRQILLRSADCMIGTGVQGKVDSAENLELTETPVCAAPEEDGAEPWGNDSNENLLPLDYSLAAQTLGIPEQTKIYGNGPSPVGSAPEVGQEAGAARLDRNSYLSTYGYSFYRTDVFADVGEDRYYEIPVAWAYGEGITQGLSAARFGPDQNCTRGEFVTFLWRAEDQPAPIRDSNPFEDLQAKRFYYDAVLWAFQTGVTNGTARTLFSPDLACTRGEVVTFLWRAMGCPEPTGSHQPFADVQEGRFYSRAVLWAVENNITNGTDPNHFSPAANCTRAQVVSFLYRAVAQ